MFMKIPKETFELGDAIPAEIIFVNTSDKPLVLKEDPQKSLDLLMHAVDRATGEDLNYAMGKIKVTGFGQDSFALSVPVKEDFEMAPKAVHSFPSDLNDRLYLSPGTYDCFLTNYVVEKSNTLTLNVTFAPASFLYLLKTAVDGRQSYGKREWALDLLKQAVPGIDLQLVLDTEPAEKKREKTEANDRAYARWKKWWDDNHQSEDFLKRVRALNPH